MNYYAGIDVSLELSSVCMVDATGKVGKETKVETRPEVLVELCKGFGLPSIRIGLEAGPLSQWLYAGLTDAGLEITLLETRHGKGGVVRHAGEDHRRDSRGMADHLQRRRMCHEPQYLLNRESAAARET